MLLTMKKERFEAITDAVLAIIITLMVLEIKIPELTAANAPRILQQILIYAVSFTQIAILWLNHHNMFARVERVNLDTVWLNFGLLFLTSLLPLATEHISENFFQRGNHIFYGAVMSVMSIFYNLLQGRVPGHASPLNRWAIVVNLLSIPLSFVSVYLSGAIFLFIPLAYFVLSRRPATA